MPIIRHQDKVLYFAHIPKCAGTSLEDYLASIEGVSVAMLDRMHLEAGKPYEWSLSSPQHMPGDVCARFFPAGFFDAVFAILREPTSRFVSAYLFQKYVQMSIPQSINVDEFIQSHLTRNYADPGWCDAHFMPQRNFIDQNMDYDLFRLEDGGLEQVVRYLSELLKTEMSPAKIPHSNATLVNGYVPNEKVELSAYSQELLNAIYCDDFHLYDSLNASDSTTLAMPIGFNPEIYLQLNPDVQAAGMDAFHHFILHGRHEGRNWGDR